MVSFLAALALWLFFAWPIPRAMTSGISSASLNVEKGSSRAMIPGDHLQLLYQFWLTGDTLKGNTPAFVNPYEFNVGNDAAGAFRGTYYVPFSLFYAAGAALGGPAFGYNVAQFITVWLAFLFLWLMVRRYCRDDLTAALAAMVGTALPYAWITMFDGSPTGLAMMFIPLIVWALDVMVVDRKAWAGAVAGAAICLAESDSHVFFFALLSAPFWCVFSYLFHFPGRRPSRDDWRSLFKSSIWLIVFLGVALWQTGFIRHSIQDTALAATSRSVEEIRAGSPSLSGLIRLANVGEGRKIYVGGYLMALLAMGAAAVLRARRRGKDTPPVPLAALVLLGMAVIGVVLLSSGVMNPAGPRAWKVVMTLIPPYALIRQPHKIYCLMPALLALASGILWPCLAKGIPSRWRSLAGVAMVIPLILDYGGRIHPTVCVLDREQGAFRAIADDAKATHNVRPHFLSLPLWPGDSHYDSLNEYYVSLYRLRMVNGYGGTVRKAYRENVFQPLESMNIGAISDSQLDFLAERGVGYLVLHEDCFPEKVSPFPVGQTLEALLNHPRLTRIGQDGAMWSFKILSAAAEPARDKVSFADPVFSARRFEFESLQTSAGPALPSSKGAGSIVLSEGPDSVSFAVRIPASLVSLDRPLSWLIRARGQGAAHVANVIGTSTNAPTTLVVASPEWTWTKVAIPTGAGVAGVGAAVSWAEGRVELDSAILAGGDWSSPAPGQSVEWPAVCFFHAGASDRQGRWVELRAAYEPDAIVFYGPKLPLDPGTYSVELLFDSQAPAGTLLGQFNIRWAGNETDHWVPVKQGLPAVARFEQKDNRSFFVAFEFLRAADIRIRSVVLTRGP